MSSALERVLRRDRLVIGAALAALTALSWVQMVGMAEGELFGTTQLLRCCGTSFWMAFSMWVVMMAGMMIPSVAPMVLTHAAIMRRRGGAGAPFALASSSFLSGYLLAWTGFSAIAAFVQWALHRAALLDPRALTLGPWAGGAVLIAAAAFQFAPAKDACLSQCRAPLGYFMTEWRDGHLGAVQMGFRHGVFCIGCCWFLMAVLFAVGIMNIVWSALITAFVLAEKLAPWRRAVVWAGAATCVVAGLALMGSAALGR